MGLLLYCLKFPTLSKGAFPQLGAIPLSSAEVIFLLASPHEILFRFKFCFSNCPLRVMLVIFALLSWRIFPYMVFSIGSSFPADVFRFDFDQVSFSSPPMLLFLVLLLPTSLPFYFIILLTLFHFGYDFLLTVVVSNSSQVIVYLA